MGDRLSLHAELLTFTGNVYLQPPAGFMMKYPCVVYNKTGKSKEYASNGVYLKRQGYQLTVIDKNPDSDIADRIEDHFQYCGVTNYATIDNLTHTYLSLYY